MDDKQIIQLYFDRSEDALHQSQSRFGKLCFRIAHNILGDHGDSEECVNDTWLGLWNAIPPQRPENLTAFVSRVARNIALKRYEHNTAAKRNPDMVMSLSELEEILPDHSFRPELEDGELGAAINAFLRQEKEEAREVFLRKYWFFDSVENICDRYGYSQSKVKSMLLRTRSRLKDHLIKEGLYL